MISISFVVTLPIFIAAIVVFGIGLIRKKQRDSAKTMTAGLVVGLLGVIIAAIMFIFFSL